MGFWGKITGQKKYRHYSYARTLTRNDGPYQAAFTASSTISINSIRMTLGNSGNVATYAKIRFLDAQSKKQIGNMVQVYLAAGAAFAPMNITGFSSFLIRGRAYYFEVDYVRPDLNAYTAPQQGSASYSVVLQIGGVVSATTTVAWRIPVGGGTYIIMAGREGYQASGVAWRTLDVGSVPSVSGVMTYVDKVPAGTSLTVEAWYTNDPALAAVSGVTGWTSHGVVVSGDTIPAAQYWRVKISMTSTTGNDDTPEISALSVSYYGDPFLFGTHLQAVPLTTGGTVTQASLGLSGISTSSSAIEPQLKKQMVGRMTSTLAPEPEVDSLANMPLRGHRAQIRIGYNNVPDTLALMDGIVRDVAWGGGHYSLTINDALEMADAQAPNTRWPLWDVAVAYLSGDIVAYNGKGWLALKNNTGVAPGSDPTTWQEYGSVWKELDYTPASNGGVDWHLCDIVKDLLTNAINLPAQKLDLASVDAVKVLRPNMTSSGRRITRPEKARTLLDELAWLLEAQWVERDGLLTLLPDPDANTVPVDVIGPDDIAEGLQFRYGQAEAKNEALILTGYTGQGGNDPGQFSDGIAAVDAQSITDLDAVLTHQFQDKWNVPQSELTRIATNYVTRWAYGRKRVRVKVTLRMMALEPGDVVTLRSGQLPAGILELNMMVVRRDLDWMRQALTLDLLEV